MNFHIDSKAFIKNIRWISKEQELDSNIELTIHVKTWLHLPVIYYLIIEHLEQLVSFEVPIEYFLPSLRLIQKLDKKHMSTIFIHKPLTNYQKKALSKVQKNFIIIKDTSNCESNLEFYKTNEYLLYETTLESMLQELIAFDLAYFKTTTLPCIKTSCLGQTLYLNAENQISYCPYHPEETIICHIQKGVHLSDYLESSFMKDTVGECKAPLTCSNTEGALKTAIEQAKIERESILQENIPLNSIHLYKRWSILRQICGSPEE